MLAIDYRTAPGPDYPWDGTVEANTNSWPAAVNDIIQALEWLTLKVNQSSTCRRPLELLVYIL